MKHGFLKVAAVTPKIRVADPMYNAQIICENLQSAYDKKAKMIVFPELCITGYTCQDLFFQETLLKQALDALRTITAYTEGHDALVFVGLPVRRLQKLYDVVAVLQDGVVLGMVPKSYPSVTETRWFTSGNEETVEFLLDDEEIPFGSKQLFACEAMPDLLVGCEIGGDIWAPQSVATEHAQAGATVIVNPSADYEIVGKSEMHDLLVKIASAKLLCGYVCANAGEGESTQDYVFAGGNLIAENGQTLKQSDAFETGMICSDLDIQRLTMERQRTNSFLAEERLGYLMVPFGLDAEIVKLDRKYEKSPFIPTNEDALKKRCEEILNIQAYGLKKRYEHTKSQSAVIGVSGGLDSTLALLIIAKCFDLLGKDRKDIVAVTMPCFGTTDRTYQNACKLAQTLGATLKEIDIKKSVLQHFEDIGHDVENHNVVYENAQARERTKVIMDIANQVNGLVIGTGDMSELALGWATYNGDHMSMYGVNAGVPKTMMRHLVRYYAEMCGSKELRAVLLDVLDTPVSPELLPPANGVIAQKTEDLVGPYELHDFYLYYVMRFGFSPEKIYRIAKEAFGGEYAYETILKWLRTFYRRFFTQQFKRSCLPDGPKVGSVGVSPRGDLSMPSDACMQIWAEEAERLK